MHLVRPHAPTQYLRIFVIVHITSFFITKSILDSYYHKQVPKPQQIHQLKPQKSLREKLATSGVPDYSGASETLRTARERAVALPVATDSLSAPSSSSSSSSSHSTYSSSSHTQLSSETDPAMAPKKENTKKAAGNAKKAEVAAAKAAAADAAAEQNESSKWNQGAKSNKKQADAAEKKAQQAAAKAERERLLKEEEKDAPAKPKSAGAKKAEKKLNDRAPASKGTLNLDDLDSDTKDGKNGQDSGIGNKKETTLNASSIDAALDALNLTQSPNTVQIDRHPERRVKAAYAAFEARRLPEIEKENPGLRRNQRVEMCRREFEKSEENPFNQGNVGRFDMSREEMGEVRRKVREGVEGYLGEK